MAEIDKMRIDHGLIGALVELWRPETNTFHFSSGEATITLEDVAYIYGLPMDARPVTGRTISNLTAIGDLCTELSGIAPDLEQDCEGSQIKLTWFQKHFRSLPKRATQEVENRYTRAYLFCLVAGQISTNTSGLKGSAFLLDLFRNFDSYAWGLRALQTFIEIWVRLHVASKQ